GATGGIEVDDDVGEGGALLKEDAATGGGLDGREPFGGIVPVAAGADPGRVGGGEREGGHGGGGGGGEVDGAAPGARTVINRLERTGGGAAANAHGVLCDAG